MRTSSTTLVSALGIAVLAAVSGCSAGQPSGTTTTSAGSTSTSAPPSSTASAKSETATLQYLMEEEKLAHDVYQRFAQLWGTQTAGTRIFGNITSSEVTHQQLLVPVLQAKGIADPRTATAGTFSNPDIQKMYDELVKQGSASVTEAYKAGVTIEQRDISGLTADLATTTDPAAKAVMQQLLAGSQKHLQAFQSRLG